MIKGYGKKSFGKNVGTEIKAGKPKKQAVAIAFSTKRSAKKKAGKGGGDFMKKIKGLKGK